MTRITSLIVRKDDLSQRKLTTHDAPPLAPGEALAKVDRFAFTANNVTYGVVGERIGYWKFFPTAEDGWGIIPVWGFADIVESNAPDVRVGERLYGYWPMASHLVLSPAKVKETRLTDGAAHRAELPPVYNAYARVSNDADYDPSMDDERMTLHPLYATSYCLYDFSKDNGWFGATQAIIPSASSKTAIGVAYAFRADPQSPRIVGVTSLRNAAAVRALGLYDDVIVYDDMDSRIDAAAPALIIDMSGSGPVIGRLHKLLGDNMRYTSNVGITHYDAGGMGVDFIRERSAMFFAPGHIQKRAADWGPGVFERKAFEFWRDSALKSREWLAIRRETGADAVERAFADVYGGCTAANAAWVVGF
ncbi:MAG: DUF2855 family protein [Alphaproteobacteria bacterium]|nr:DUF2855 family protein [Alphaproteobacteria bacterium]